MKWISVFLVVSIPVWSAASGRVTCHIDGKIRQISPRGPKLSYKYKGSSILQLEGVTTNCKFDPAEISRYSKFSTDEENLKVGDSFQKDILCFSHKGGGRVVYSCSAPN